MSTVDPQPALQGRVHPVQAGEDGLHDLDMLQQRYPQLDGYAAMDDAQRIAVLGGILTRMQRTLDEGTGRR